MKASFYSKLAWEGIRKNKKLYYPYILSGSIMVIMYYILSFLVESPALSHMSGGSILMDLLQTGSGIIAVFSVVFLLYTNSFLMKQRYREFGLYNILGMNQRNISKIMIWETFFVAVLSIVSGLVIGIALSKAAELVLLNLVNMDITYKFSVGMNTLRNTPLIYGGIYLLLLLNTLIKVRRSKPLELMQSAKVGERIPKRNWIYGAVGVILLGVAYYLAISIENPIAALSSFFVAVILVIIGTYLIFMFGSVVFCKLLQKNKKYYYKSNHFVSVSSLVYRMKRNGAGLASICIFLTMVLVMISSTASLYFSEEDSLNNRCPNDVNITVNFDNIQGISDENISFLQNNIRQISGEKTDLTGTRTCEIAGLFSQEGIIIDTESYTNFSASTYDNVGYLSVLSLSDYNNMMETAQTLADDECLIYCDRLPFQWDTFSIEYGGTYNVKEQLEEFHVNGESMSLVVRTVFLVVNDVNEFSKPFANMKNTNGDPMMMYIWNCGFDVDTPELEIAATANLKELLRSLDINNDETFYSYSVNCHEEQRKSFYEVYGGLFFLGIMLSAELLFATVLIIYYKQISEGYEDQARFVIMQNVGMTKREIRKSINSQMLTVFFLPLLIAGIHLCFAFSFIWKILRLFGFTNVTLVMAVMALCLILFGFFYALIYKMTSNAYYRIVSRKN